jgi:hypothetical protein
MVMLLVILILMMKQEQAKNNRRITDMANMSRFSQLMNDPERARKIGREAGTLAKQLVQLRNEGALEQSKVGEQARSTALLAQADEAKARIAAMPAHVGLLSAQAGETKARALAETGAAERAATSYEMFEKPKNVLAKGAFERLFPLEESAKAAELGYTKDIFTKKQGELGTATMPIAKLPKGRMARQTPTPGFWDIDKEMTEEVAKEIPGNTVTDWLLRKGRRIGMAVPRAIGQGAGSIAEYFKE